MGVSDTPRQVASQFIVDTGVEEMDLQQEVLTAFLEHRLSLVLVRRQELKDYFQKYVRTAPHIRFTSWGCVAENQGEFTEPMGLIERDGMVSMDLSVFNVYRATEWEFYFNGVRLSNIRYT